MRISKEFCFEASHILPRHRGKCSRLHGHSWRLEVEVWGAVELETGFVIDFAELKKFVAPIIERFDHRHLNCFVRYPSSENVATHIAHELWATLALKQSDRLVVKISETQNTWAVWDSTVEEDWARLSDPKDEEWKSPEVHLVPGSASMLAWYARKAEKADDLFVAWEINQTEMEQIRLYIESMSVPVDGPPEHKERLEKQLQELKEKVK